MYRHHPQTRTVRELVEEGAIGTPRLVRGTFSFLLNRPGDVRYDAALGGGALWDVGCYPVSYARYVLSGEPVEACCTPVIGDTGVDLTSAGYLRFEAGVLCLFDCSYRAASPASIEVVGTDGTIEVPTPYKPGLAESIVLHRGADAEVRHVDGEPWLHRQDRADRRGPGCPNRSDPIGGVQFRAIAEPWDSNRQP